MEKMRGSPDPSWILDGGKSHGKDATLGPRSDFPRFSAQELFFLAGVMLPNLGMRIIPGFDPQETPTTRLSRPASVSPISGAVDEAKPGVTRVTVWRFGRCDGAGISRTTSLASNTHDSQGR